MTLFGEWHPALSVRGRLEDKSGKWRWVLVVLCLLSGLSPSQGIAAGQAAKEGGESGKHETEIHIIEERRWAAGTVEPSKARAWVEQQLASLIGLGGASALTVSRQDELPGQSTLFRTTQTYAGRTVVGREGAVVIGRDGAVTTLADFRPIPEGLRQKPLIEIAEALSRADVTTWPDAKPQLVYIERADMQLRLSYEVDGADLKSSNLPRRFYLDAETGEIIHTVELFNSALRRKVYDFGAICRQLGLGQRIPEEISLRLISLVLNTPARTESQRLRPVAAVDGVYDLLGKGYEYMDAVFRIDSFDGQGREFVALAGVKYDSHNELPQCIGEEFNAAFYSDGKDFALLFIPENAISVPEVIGHEMAHGIVVFGSGLIASPRSADPASLNESLADIMGIGFRVWLEHGGLPVGVENDSRIWKMRSPTGIIRDMSAPSSLGGPDHYSQYQNSNRIPPHYNANIMDMGFYLMAVGGSHPRLGGTRVQGIGLEKTVKIAGLAARSTLPDSAEFRHARMGLALAAEHLFHGKGAEWTAVHQAMDAIGMPGTWQPIAPEAPASSPTPTAPAPTLPAPPSSPPTPAPTDTPLPQSNPPPAPQGEVRSVRDGLLALLIFGCIGTAVWYVLKNQPRLPTQSDKSDPDHTKLPEVSAGVSSATKAPIHLEALDGSEPLPLFPALLDSTDGVVVGRSMGLVHVCMESRQVSRRHARIFRSNGVLYVEDLNSTQGTMLDGRPLPPFQPVPVIEGQLVRFAGFSYCLRTRSST